MSYLWKRRQRRAIPGRSYVPVAKGLFEGTVYKSDDVLDLEIKLAVLKVSPAVVCIKTYQCWRRDGTKRSRKEWKGIRREMKVDQDCYSCTCSGTIVECEWDENNGMWIGTVLTSASIFSLPHSPSPLQPEDHKVKVYLADGNLCEGQIHGFDCHYNVAVVKIISEVLLPTALLRHLDDSIPLNLEELGDSKPFRLLADNCSNLFNIHPGDKVVALGRVDYKSQILVVPGLFSIDWCGLDCQELFKASCKTTKNFIGGPLVNCNGEVIGMNFLRQSQTHFLPINIAFRCLEHLKKHRRVHRPWLGMELTNLYAARLELLEKLLQKDHDICEGVVVEKVEKGSPAERAGILCDDVIIRCGENIIRCSLELFEALWDKAGESVEVVVKRASSDESCLKLTMIVDETGSDSYNR
ncbi:hypothetical protein Ancab_001233 [Ancistrocladus abbreviatus]